MASFAKNCVSSIIPGLRYHDAPAAIEWLCRAFGFEKNAVYMSDASTVEHAQLTFGNGMIMIGSSSNNSVYGKLIQHPAQAGFETQSPYLVVSDCDAIYASAKAAGAEIVIELEDKGYGGKGFTCRDPEGHLWSIGEYDPWEQPSA